MRLLSPQKRPESTIITLFALFALFAVLPALAPMLVPPLAPAGFAATGSPEVPSFAERAERLGVPGGAVAYLDDGAVTRTEVFGTDGEGRPVDAATPMLWGSVSKPVATAVVKHLADEGTLDPAASAHSYVPGTPNVPVSSLLDPTSGLGFGAGHLDVDRPDATAIDVVGGMSGETGESGTVGEHGYSSLGYLHLQAVVEAATGGAYADAVRATPGLSHVGASTAECADVPRGHRLAGPFAWAMNTGYDGAGAAYGYSCGSIDDLAGFAVSQLGTAADVADSLADATPTGSPNQFYGPGWRVTNEDDGLATVWHTGTLPGYFSAVYLDAESGDGAVVLLNASGFLHEESLAALTRSAFDEATGRTVTPVEPGGMGVIVPAVLLGVAALVLVLGWVGRRRMRPVAWILLTVVVVAAALIAAPLLMGVTLRYFWLWEPGVVVAAAAVPVAMLLAAAIATASNGRDRGPS